MAQEITHLRCQNWKLKWSELMQREPASLAAPKPKLITNKDLAGIMQISVRQLHRMKSRGKVIEPIKIGKLPRWNLEQVEQWIQNGCQPPETANNAGGGHDG